MLESRTWLQPHYLERTYSKRKWVMVKEESGHAVAFPMANKEDEFDALLSFIVLM